MAKGRRPRDPREFSLRLEPTLDQALMAARRGLQMQRVTQMSVTPDLLPEIAPQADLRIQIAQEQIVPGVFTKPADVRSDPRL